MNLLTGITDAARQNTTIRIADGTRATLLLEYRPQQLGWFFDLAHENFALKGVRLVASPNILRAWRDLLPFGLAVVTTSAVEPTGARDFVDGVAQIYLLDAEDVIEVEETIFTGF